MSGEKNKKRNVIETYDPDLKLSRFKKFQIRFNIKKEKFILFYKHNKTCNFYKTLISDVFIYALLCSVIFIPFSEKPIIMGLSFGSAIWLYINRFHGIIKELLSSLKIVNTVRYGK